MTPATLSTYLSRRGELQTYFDQTAVKAWERLTSDAPVSGIRRTVREGRDRMRATLLSWLPADLHGRRLLDAGCGTGALAVEAARRGAEVVAVDLSPTLVGLARERAPAGLHIDFRSGDMLDPAFGTFDHVVAMDSLIHYEAPDLVRALAALSARATGSVVFTFAPRTPLLATMHAAGRLFPRRDRAPAIEPIRPATLHHLLATTLPTCRQARTLRVDTSFYKSEALELTHE